MYYLQPRNIYTIKQGPVLPIKATRTLTREPIKMFIEKSPIKEDYLHFNFFHYYTFGSRTLNLFPYYVFHPRNLWEQGWRSGESTRLPPMWPGFDSRTRRHMCVEFVVDSRPCSEGFSPGSPVFLPPQKPTLLNSNSTWNARTPLNEFLELFGASWVNNLHLH